jgi:histidine triad (HIT) family protein
MASIFTRIINGEIPCHKVAESDDYFAFLDISPLTKGHTLLVPKVEVDQYFDLDDVQLAGLTLFSKRIAKALKNTVDCMRVGVIVAGLEVPHAHVHLVPMTSEGDLSFSKERVNMTQEEFAALAEKIAIAYGKD